MHNTFIEFLNRQDWVDKNRIYLVGHSQGSNVAASIGLVNKKVGKVILVSCNGNSRFYQSVRKIRYDENHGLFSGREAHSIKTKIMSSKQPALLIYGTESLQDLD